MLKIGTVYRYSYVPDHVPVIVDGMPNYYHETYVPGYNSFKFQKGIHFSQSVTGPDGIARCPVIIISSSPHKAGSEDTPWQDEYNPDHGYVLYYGDNKSNDKKPDDPSLSNSKLLELFTVYKNTDPTIRSHQAVPIVFFERTTVDGRSKGNLRFQGFGIIDTIELVTQYDSKKNTYFPNYRFNFCVFTLKNDGEGFDWNWIAKRCDNTLTIDQTTQYAPNVWKRWINEGSASLHLFRRNVASQFYVPELQQKVSAGSLEQKILDSIYHYYDNRKHMFEYLAMEATMILIEKSGAKCTPGWITKKSGDGGIDFVLRIDIGSNQLAGLKIIVLGQAKCTKIDTPTNGVDIARTVARLRRGMIGSFVTLSYFSRSVQVEVKTDEYPIILINGKTVATIVLEQLIKNGLPLSQLDQYLDSLEAKYSMQNRSPEDILYY